MEVRVRIPRFNLDKAVELYNAGPYIGTKEIMELFGVSDNTAAKLKKLALAKQEEKGRSRWDSRAVSIDCAYEAWGLDIDDLKRRQLSQDKIEKRRREWGIKEGCPPCG